MPRFARLLVVIVVIFSLLSTSYGVTPTVDKRALSAALGEWRIKDIKFDNDHAIKSFSKDFSDLQRDSFAHFYTCIDHSSSEEFNIARERLVLMGSAHPLAQRSEVQESCYLIFDTKEKAENVMTEIGLLKTNMVRSFGVVPTVMKFHPYALDAFTGQALEMVPQLGGLEGNFTRAKINLNERDLSSLELMVDFGLGSDRPIHHHLRRDLKTHVEEFSRGHRSLKSFSVKYGYLSPTHSKLWQDSLRHLESHQNANVCGFSKLSIREHENGAVIRDLHYLAETTLDSLNRHRASSQATFSSCYYSLLSVLGSHEHVVNVGIRQKMRAFNAVGKSIVQTGTSTGTFVYTKAGLDGTGQVVGVGDTGLDDKHCMFSNSDGSVIKRSTYTNPYTDSSKRKVIQYIAYADNGDASGGHGTHVSGTVAGNNINNAADTMNGHASGAKIAFFDMGKSGESIEYPQPLSKYVLSAAKSAGAHVYSASWGSDMNIYSSDCIDIDGYSVTNDDFLFVVAAGNDGSQGYFSIGDPALSKNALTVGCSESSASVGNLAFFSSIGPTYDMRIKPDIVAPGFYTYSANAKTQCSTLKMAGTSMATPAVSGVSLQVRQYFSTSSFWASICNTKYRNCAPFSPKGATVKAVVIHSGKGMTYYNAYARSTFLPSTSLSKTPSYFQGFGRVYMPNVLPLPGTISPFDLFVDENSVTSSMKITYKVQVSAATADFKATLVWMDPANSVISVKTLVNDLDLVVVDPNGNVYRGNGGFKDSVNNVEQVLIPYSMVVVGEYSVTVVADVFPYSSSQSYSLVITSKGEVTSIGDDVPDTTSDVATLNCPSGSAEVWIEMFDHGGNGWGSGNKYQITNTDTESTVTGSLTSSFYDKSGICLPYGSYEIELDQGGSQSNEMGLNIDGCGVYLSSYKTSGKFSIDSSGCNTCYGQIIDVVLAGSFYGIQYGWHGTTSYKITRVSDSKIVHTGTLVSGVLQTQSICVSQGTYAVSFSAVAATDDFNFFYDDSYAPYFGKEEYYIYASACDGDTEAQINAYNCDSNQVCTANYASSNLYVTCGSTMTAKPTAKPTVPGTKAPTFKPTPSPTIVPTVAPTIVPTRNPTAVTTSVPTVEPTPLPTVAPTESPTLGPGETYSPTPTPTYYPTPVPTLDPTSYAPTVRPTSQAPTASPTTLQPTFKPTAAPTFKPTYKPTNTRAPTFAPTNEPVMVYVTQTITGIAYFDYLNNKENIENVFKLTVAESIGAPITANDITINSVTSTSSRRLLDAAMIINSNTGISLDYVVASSANGISYTSVSTALSTSVSTGQFTSNLQTLASNNGVTELSNAQAPSDGLTVSSGTTDSKSSSGFDYMTYVIYGAIAIGGLLIMTMLFRNRKSMWVFCCGSDKEQEEEELERIRRLDQMSRMPSAPLSTEDLDATDAVQVDSKDVTVVTDNDMENGNDVEMVPKLVNGKYIQAVAVPVKY